MRVYIIGSGNIATQMWQGLKEKGIAVSATIPVFSCHHLTEFGGCDAIVVIAPEFQTNPDELQAAARSGVFPFIITAGNDPLYAWAGSNQIPTYPYPPSQGDYEKLIFDLNKLQAGGAEMREGMYRRANLPGQAVSLLTNAIAIRRKIVVTSAKGGTGKTTVAVNLAYVLAMCGVKTYLVDADANGGAMSYHMRAHKINEGKFHANLLSEIQGAAARLQSEGRNEDPNGVWGMAESVELLRAFTEVPDMPCLKYLPGIPSEELANKTLDNGAAVEKVIVGLFEAGASTDGVVIMDVGINPTHPVHRVAVRKAEAVAMVIKPEVPDISATKLWLSMMVKSSMVNWGMTPREAIEYLLPKIKLCYNMVFQNIEEIHQALGDALYAKIVKITKDPEISKRLDLTPNGILPVVTPVLSSMSTSSNDAEDIFIRRFKKRREEELKDFSSQLVTFAANFVPPIYDSAASLGLITSNTSKSSNRLSIFKKKK